MIIQALNGKLDTGVVKHGNQIQNKMKLSHLKKLVKEAVQEATAGSNVQRKIYDIASDISLSSEYEKASTTGHARDAFQDISWALDNLSLMELADFFKKIGEEVSKFAQDDTKTESTEQNLKEALDANLQKEIKQLFTPIFKNIVKFAKSWAKSGNEDDEYEYWEAVSELENAFDSKYASEGGNSILNDDIYFSDLSPVEIDFEAIEEIGMGGVNGLYKWLNTKFFPALEKEIKPVSETSLSKIRENLKLKSKKK